MTVTYHLSVEDLCLVQRVDLGGEREFMTGESTEDALAAMLEPGSSIAQVPSSHL